MKYLKSAFVVFIIGVMLVMGFVFFYQPPQGPIRPLHEPGGVPEQIRVYFNKATRDNVVTEPVFRKLPEAHSQKPSLMIAYAVRELIDGPTAQEKAAGLFSEIPQGTALLGVTEHGDKISVNLSGGFTEGGGSNSMSQRLQQVIKTVVSIPQKKPVYLQVEGKQLDVLGGEGVMVNEPINNDPSVSQ